MSNIGCKPITVQGVQVEVKGQEIHYKGSKSSGVYVLPDGLVAQVSDGKLTITPRENGSKVPERSVKRIWGLHRSLVASKISGAAQEFERQIAITGLGYKAVKSGTGLVFTLGFSHKIDFALPEGVTVDIDKTGQRLVFKSPDKELVGQVCSQVRTLRPPEPYKGTGIRVGGNKGLEEIIRKAGKTKAAA